MEYETYEDVIDAYNSGVGVEAGESLTDYIKRNNKYYCNNFFISSKF